MTQEVADSSYSVEPGAPALLLRIRDGETLILPPNLVLTFVAADMAYPPRKVLESAARANRVRV